MFNQSSSNPLSDPQAENGNQKPQPRKAAQDRQISNNVTLTIQIIDTIRSNPELSSLLAARGYDDAKLQEGDTLILATQDGWDSRQTAMSGQKSAIKSLINSESDAWIDYVDFRSIARGAFPEHADQVKLGLPGNITKDRQRFINRARASYEAALQEPYYSVLAPQMGGPDSIQTLLDRINALPAIADQHGISIGTAKGATRSRDAADRDLTLWRRQLLRVAKSALRERDDLWAMMNPKRMRA